MTARRVQPVGQENPRLAEKRLGAMGKRKPPDLYRCTDEELQAFWQDQDPSQVESLGDQLLAESLPRYNARSYDFAFPAQRLTELRQTAGLTLEQLAERLGVNPQLLAAWEGDQLKIPGSLYLIYQRLSG